MAGKGNNGADGRIAADRLRTRGARVVVVAAGETPDRLGGEPRFDLVIDAAYGTGFRGSYRGTFCAPGRTCARSGHPFGRRR